MRELIITLVFDILIKYEVKLVMAWLDSTLVIVDLGLLVSIEPSDCYIAVFISKLEVKCIKTQINVFGLNYTSIIKIVFITILWRFNKVHIPV